jgi:hypothetical protein
MTDHARKPISNVGLIVRVAGGGAIFGGVAFASGYYEPIFLFKDAGVAPIAGFLIWPFGFGFGVIFGIVESIKGNSVAKYGFHLFVFAFACAVAIAALFLIG